MLDLVDGGCSCIVQLMCDNIFCVIGSKPVKYEPQNLVMQDQIMSGWQLIILALLLYSFVFYNMLHVRSTTKEEITGTLSMHNVLTANLSFIPF